MTSLRSMNNFSLTPLQSERIYLGTWDSVLQYLTASVTLTASTDCEIIAYQSIDKLNQISTVYEAPSAHGTFSVNIPIQYPYIYFTVRNTTANTQTQFNFEVIYRSVPVANLVNTSVDINDSNGNPILSSSGVLLVADTVAETSLASIVSGLAGTLNVAVTNTVVVETDSNSLAVTVGNFPSSQPVSIDNVVANNNCLNTALYDSTGTPLTATSGSLNVLTQSGLGLDASLQTIITNTQTLINQSLSVGGALWNGATLVANNAVSTTINMTAKNSVTYSYFGNCVPDTIIDSPVLTIQYSGDGTTFYPSPNVISLGAGGGNFSIDTISGSGYVNCVVSGLTTTATITMILNHL